MPQMWLFLAEICLFFLGEIYLFLLQLWPILPENGYFYLKKLANKIKNLVTLIFRLVTLDLDATE